MDSSVNLKLFSKETDETCTNQGYGILFGISFVSASSHRNETPPPPPPSSPGRRVGHPSLPPTGTNTGVVQFENLFLWRRTKRSVDWSKQACPRTLGPSPGVGGFGTPRRRLYGHRHPGFRKVPPDRTPPPDAAERAQPAPGRSGTGATSGSSVCMGHLHPRSLAVKSSKPEATMKQFVLLLCVYNTCIFNACCVLTLPIYRG